MIFLSQFKVNNEQRDSLPSPIKSNSPSTTRRPHYGRGPERWRDWWTVGPRQPQKTCEDPKSALFRSCTPTFFLCVKNWLNSTSQKSFCHFCLKLVTILALHEPASYLERDPISQHLMVFLKSREI